MGVQDTDKVQQWKVEKLQVVLILLSLILIKKLIPRHLKVRSTTELHLLVSNTLLVKKN